LYNKPDSKAVIADVDCTADSGKGLCEKFGVQGYPTIKYWNKDTADDGEKYEEAREYAKLKKFVKSMSKDPCNLETQENCNKKEKTFIEELSSWDEAKVKTESESYKTQLETAKTTHQDLADLFEKQKDEAMATMKLQEEAKKDLDKLTKSLKYKLSILDQKGGKKDEL
jgi:protein disulfide-isomerase A6